MDAPTVTAPILHMNGSDAWRLRDAIFQARVTTQAAIAALQDAAPNARDYYPAGPAAYPAARTEHERRLHRLADNVAELGAILDAIDEQEEQRQQRRSNRP